MTTIKLKNGSGAPLAGDLVVGEPALDLTNKRLYTEDSGGTVIEVGTNPTSLTTGTFTSTGIDDNAASTAMTLDASGNLLVGNTVTDPATSNVNGVAITAGGEVIASLNGVAAQFNRRTSDGDIAVFKKGGTTVGSIGVLSSRFYIGSGDTGLKFSGADDLISPIDASDGTGRDAAIDLGSSGARFKDLYLSGTVTADTLDIDNLKILSGQSTTPTNDASPLIYKTTSHSDYANGDLIIQARSSASRDIYMLTGTTTPVNRLQVNGNGNISFYEDTGTTAKLFWDASAESLGIGSTSPVGRLDVSGGADGTIGSITLAQGNTTSKVAKIYGTSVNTNEKGIRFNTFHYGDVDAVTITSNGNVGIGTSSPSAPLSFGANIPSDGQTIHTYHSGNTRSGLGIVAGAHRLFTNTGSVLSFGQVSTSDGSTYSEAMRIDSSSNLLVGKTSLDVGVVGQELRSSGFMAATRDGSTVGAYTRLNSDGTILEFRKDSSAVGSIGTTSASFGIGQSDTGLGFFNTDRLIFPATSAGAIQDNVIDLGYAGARFDDIFATNGTIQTSDRNEKQDIEALSDAEQRVAVAAKGLLRKFRWIDSVEEKGDDARIHFGIIAQDLQDAFTAEGLDAGRYAMFISTTWWESTEVIPAVEAQEAVVDEEGNVVEEAVEAQEERTVVHTHDTTEEAPEGSVERTRLGVRYPQLLAFIIAAI
jgi:hypothetical protein